jgi:hypothetical protein
MSQQLQKLPTLAELQASPEQAYKDDQFNWLLNQPIPATWLKTHPTFKNKYLPIDKVEHLLTRIFHQWRVEVLNVTPIFNSIAVTVRLHYLRPNGPDGKPEWSFHDGVGAHNLQLDSGAAPSDLTKIKPGAVMMSLPIAKALAIKDACDHIGIIFGRDLNRKDTLTFEPTMPAPQIAQQQEAMQALQPAPVTESEINNEIEF